VPVVQACAFLCAADAGRPLTAYARSRYTTSLAFRVASTASSTVTRTVVVYDLSASPAVAAMAKAAVLTLSGISCRRRDPSPNDVGGVLRHRPTNIGRT
jgi:hypothetical protein